MSVDLEDARQLLGRDYGLQFGPSLDPRLAGAVREFPRAAFINEAAWLEGLVEQVTVQESYVLRHRGQLEAVAGRIPMFGRVWSAACAHGEEALSMAIVLQHQPSVEIFASDVSHDALAIARGGYLRPWSLRGLEPSMIRRHFLELNGGYLVRPELASRVRYEHLNLARPSTQWPGAIDVVLLRNVLLYFTEAQISAVLGRVRTILQPEGLLVVAPAEAGLVRAHGWSAVRGMPTGCVAPTRPFSPLPIPPLPALAPLPPAMALPSHPVPVLGVVLVEPQDASTALARRLVRGESTRDV